MRFLGIIRAVFALLAVVGLILAPLAKPAMAMASEMHSAADRQGAMTMPADMPCCPEQAPAQDCAKDCPFMAMCAAQAFSNPQQDEGPVMALVLATVILPSNDADLISLAQGPPPRPPKI
jgi:hypothetical protein